MLLPKLTVLAVVSFFLTSLPISSAQSSKLFTFDKCQDVEQCALHLDCFSVVNNTITFCEAKAESCLCLPHAFNYCKSSKQCVTGEGCAINPRSGNKLCVSCNLINHENSNYTQVDPLSIDCKPEGLIPTPDPEPVPLTERRLSYDYCSPDIPCADYLKCIDSTPAQNDCDVSSVGCTCFPPKPVFCDLPEDCRMGETCVRFTFTGQSFCASCNVVDKSIYYRPTAPSDKCKGEAALPTPQYPPSSNGNTLDSCRSDLVCQAPRKCMSPRVPLKNVPCKGPNDSCFCLQPKFTPCRFSKYCKSPGEVCAKLNVAESRVCLSKAFLAGLSRHEYKVFGKKSVPKRDPSFRGWTGSKCSLDWHCSAGRRCTHYTERFGGCAGRRGCTCEPLFRKRCKRQAACGPGEVCVNYPGSRSWPFCLSREAMEWAPLLKMSWYEAPDVLEDVVTQGLSGEPCRTDEDCVGSRQCTHVSEERGLCEGREACLCSEKKDSDGRCQSNADCVAEEVCTRVVDSLIRDFLCLSNVAFDSDPSGSLEIVPPKSVPAVTHGSSAGR